MVIVMQGRQSNESSKHPAHPRVHLCTISDTLRYAFLTFLSALYNHTMAGKSRACCDFLSQSAGTHVSLMIPVINFQACHCVYKMSARVSLDVVKFRKRWKKELRIQQLDLTTYDQNQPKPVWNLRTILYTLWRLPLHVRRTETLRMQLVFLCFT